MQVKKLRNLSITAAKALHAQKDTTQNGRVNRQQITGSGS